MLIQRTRPQPPHHLVCIGDVVMHAVHGRGVVDAIANYPKPVAFMLPWDGRGDMPRRPNYDWFSAPVAELVPAPPVGRRLQRTR